MLYFAVCSGDTCFVLRVLRGCEGALVFNFSGVRGYAVVKTSLIKIYIGVAIVYFSF